MRGPLYLTTSLATTVKTRKSDLTSDPTWVIGFYLVVKFSFIFMGETRTQDQVLIACGQVKDITFISFIPSFHCEYSESVSRTVRLFCFHWEKV